MMSSLPPPLRRQNARDLVDDALDTYFKRMDKATEIAMKVADIPNMEFMSALTEVIGFDVDVVRQKTEDITRSRNYVMESPVYSGPANPLEDVISKIYQRAAEDCSACHPEIQPNQAAHYGGCFFPRATKEHVDDVIKAIGGVDEEMNANIAARVDTINDNNLDEMLSYC